jgi:hypothetical protein
MSFELGGWPNGFGRSTKDKGNALALPEMICTMKNAVTTGDGVAKNTVRDRSAIHALPPQRMWSPPWKPLLV